MVVIIVWSVCCIDIYSRWYFHWWRVCSSFYLVLVVLVIMIVIYDELLMWLVLCIYIYARWGVYCWRLHSLLYLVMVVFFYCNYCICWCTWLSHALYRSLCWMKFTLLTVLLIFIVIFYDLLAYWVQYIDLYSRVCVCYWIVCHLLHMWWICCSVWL